MCLSTGKYGENGENIVGLFWFETRLPTLFLARCQKLCSKNESQKVTLAAS